MPFRFNVVLVFMEEGLRRQRFGLLALTVVFGPFLIGVLVCHVLLITENSGIHPKWFPFSSRSCSPKSKKKMQLG